MPLDEIQNLDPAPMGKDMVMSGDGRDVRVVTALDENVRENQTDQISWGIFLEGHYPVHTFKRGQHGHAVAEIVDRPFWALQSLYGRIRVH